MELKFYDSTVFNLSRDQWMALIPYLWLALGLAISTVYAALRASRPVGKFLAIFFLSTYAYYQAIHIGDAPQNLFGTSLEVDALTRIVGVAVSVFAIITSLFGKVSDPSEEHPEWLPLLLVSVLGLSILPGARDFVAFFVYLETLAITGYIMTAMDTSREKSLEAGLKYLLLGAFASAILLMGIALVYGATGTVDFEKISLSIHNISSVDTGFVIAGSLMITASLLFKVALVPFHMWAPDVYQAAPTSIAAYLASATKISIFAGTAVVMNKCGILNVAGVKNFIFYAATLSVVVGSFLAVAQTHVKRLFAYSGIVNAGYAAFALASGPKAVGSLVTNLLIYGGTLIGIFAVTEALVVNSGRPAHSDLAIRDLSSASKKTHPLIIGLFAFGVFSIAGIPPLPGFFGKYLILKDLWINGDQMSVYVMLFGALLGLAYYLRLFVPLYMSASEETPASGERSLGHAAALAAMLAVTFSILLMGGLNRLPSWVQIIEAFAR